MLAVAATPVGQGTTGSPAVLSATGLGHQYGDRVVLDDFSIDVHAGDVVGLLGPNGSGKSTALALLAGLVPLQRGHLMWRGVTARPGDAVLRREMGVVFQATALDGRLSVQENLQLAITLRGVFGRAATERIAELLEFTGLADRARDVVGTLSGGQRRRVDIARALIHRPRLLLLDEPSAGLDEASFRDLWARLLAQRAATGLAIIVATHRPDEAELCGRLEVLVRGRTVLNTTPSDLQRLVSGDLITITSADPATCVTVLNSMFPGAPVTLDGQDVTLRIDLGHQCIPRIVEALRDGAPLTAIGLRRPTLADAFIKATGEGLGAEL